MIEELILHLTTVKKHQLLSTFNMEAYLPFQTLIQCYEVASQLINNQQKKMDLRTMMTQRLKELEHNLMACCNPADANRVQLSRYSMMQYTLPEKYLNPMDVLVKKATF